MSESMIRRPGVISWGGLFGNSEPLKQYLLMYDEIWVPGLERLYPTPEEVREWDLDEEFLASIAWLMGEGLVREPPIEVTFKPRRKDPLIAALSELYEWARGEAEAGYRTAESAAKHVAAAQLNMDMALSRLVVHTLWKANKELAYPVLFPFQGIRGSTSVPAELKENQEVVSIVFARLPQPVADLPLEDIVAFKRDPDTRYKFARFWHWIHQVSDPARETRDLREEVDWLITDYTNHLKQLTKDTTYNRLEVWTSLPGDVTEAVVKMRPGRLLRSVFRLKRARIAAHQAELKLPGAELAYVTQAAELLTGG